MQSDTSINRAPDVFRVSGYCPLCGTSELSRDAEFLECTKCGYRSFNNPITAVAVFVFDQRQRLLLLRRARDPEKGKWVPPGGFVDAAETLEEAATRETQEETGLIPTKLAYLSSHPNYYVYGGLGRQVCDVFFTAEVSSSMVNLQREEAGDFQWMAPQEIDSGSLAFDSMRHALAILLQKTHQKR